MIRISRCVLVCAVLGVLALSGCKAPEKVEYFQDLTDRSSIQLSAQEMITLQPLDQISIVVNSREPQLAAMFNMPYFTNQMGASQSLTSGNAVSSSAAQSLSAYTVGSDGCIDFPILGKISVAGKRREEVAADIKQRLVSTNQLKDPVVTVEYINLGVSVLGEVARPGRYKIDRDRFTIFDALSLAGDMTINGERTNVRLIRNSGGRDDVYMVDFTNSSTIYNSPAYFVHQGDIIYVSPTDKRKRDSTVNGNTVRSTSFWISLSSLLVSVALLIKNF